jgi:molybdopterin converting factor small subunit
MPTKILIPTPLRPFTERRETIDLEGNTVGEVLHHLIETFPGLKTHLYSDQGKLRSFVNIYLNDSDIRYLDHEGTPVGVSDTLSIVPAIAGGIR